MKMLLSALLVLGASFWSNVSLATSPLSEDEAYRLGIEVYTYAYPLVLMETTRSISTSAAETGSMRAPMNQFAHMRAFPDATFKTVVRPNADTLYSSLWFDVGKQPLILTAPNTMDRYNVVPIMDMWTDVFAALGTRTTGNGGTTIALIGPHWQGRLPAGMRVIRSPTDIGWIIGRIQTNGPDDYDHIHKLQAGFSAAPPRRPEVRTMMEPAPGTLADTSTPAVVQVAQMKPSLFFAQFAEIMKRNPPHKSDYSILLRMERAGLFPGKSFDLSKADPAVQRGWVRAAVDAYQIIIQQRKQFGGGRNGWISLGSTLGVYGNDYLQRAFISHIGLGALPPEEAIYPMALFDSKGEPLSGAARYVLHFEKENIPPVDAFWSLTMYGDDQFFVANKLNRFSIGSRDSLILNADGSLDLFIQKDSPGGDKEANWLPAPAGPFTMNLRLYLPRRAAMDGRWTPPPVERLP